MSYQKLFNNYFSTYGSQTGGAAVPAPTPQLTQEQLNEYLKNHQGMDNTPEVKPEEAVKPLSIKAIIDKSKVSGWKRTPVRSQKFSAFSKDAVMAQGVQVNVGQIAANLAEAQKEFKTLKTVPQKPRNPLETFYDKNMPRDKYKQANVLSQKAIGNINNV